MNYLMIPICLDALYIPGEQLSVVEQTARFPVQPYVERTFKEEVNSETPNLSEAIVSQPFQNKDLRLGHGVHLHWAMPDALTRGDENLRFPELPDRWLVTRRKREGTIWNLDRQWVVESNYLFPPHINKQGTAVSIPYTSELWRYNEKSGRYEYGPSGFQYRLADLPPSIVENITLVEAIFTRQGDTLTLKETTNMEETLMALLQQYSIPTEDQTSLFELLQRPLQRSGQPYRYMGRSMPLSAWEAQFTDAEYHPSLTAVGYGEPTFAAFYPNCFSVFGFHDPTPGSDLADLRYEVAGWYSDPTRDELARLVDEASSDIHQAIKEKFNWEVLGNIPPDRLLCYAGLGFAEDFSPDHGPEREEDVTITVADTPTEALSARLADRLAENKDQLRTIEDQLEALQLSFRLQDKKLDTLARFRELRHENGFTPLNSGPIWTLRKETGEDTPSQDPSNELSSAITHALDEVNALQKAYNKAQHRIASLRRQLFADWYKYMLCVYPPDASINSYPSPDLVRHFIETKMIEPLNERVTETGMLGPIKKDGEGHITKIQASEESSVRSLAYRIAEKVNQLIVTIEVEQDQMNNELGTTTNYYLEQVPGPRYWRPNDPVLLVEGDAVTPTPRHGQDGTLQGALFETEGDQPFTGTNDFGTLTAAVAAQLQEGPSYSLQGSQPWNPFLLEWQLQLYPMEGRGNLHLGDGTYSPEFITDNYQAPVLDPDLQLKAGKGKLARTGNIYSGRSLLTPQANRLLQEAIEEQLVRKRQLFEKAKDIKAERYEGERTLDNPVYTMTRAYEELQGMRSLSQALNGFNQALLMSQQTLEQPIDDPLGFEGYRTFTREEVARTLEGHLKNAPIPLSAFQPIRSGCMRLSRLRLVDTFGQVRELSTDRIGTTYKMNTPDNERLVTLSPRLVQPARLHFRWLNAADSIMEMNSQRDTTPICGWLLTNRLDNSLFFYDAQGRALGYFKAGAWREAIDSDRPTALADISNPHLRRVAQFVGNALDQDPDFLLHFMGTVDDALRTIQPEKDMGIQGAALLLGRPVAVVRASLCLELQGLPAINQDWNAFRMDMAKGSRTTDGFPQVSFPVRLGEYGQLNDGLVGYWLEQQDAAGAISFTSEQRQQDGSISTSGTPVFYAPQSDYIDTTAIESRFEYMQDGPINFYQSVGDRPQQLTLLMDVQGNVHATAGILPNKVIDIPREQYAKALQEIEVSFLHAPLITPRGRTQLPLRELEDHAWSWVERTQQEDGIRIWEEQFPENRMARQRFIQEWEAMAEGLLDGDALWTYLLGDQVRWLVPTDDDEDGSPDTDQARVVNAEDRGITLFDGDLKGAEALVEALLAQHSVGIDPTVVEATYGSTHEIREGWLKLRMKNKQ